MMISHGETICAPATAPSGAIAVIRVSGRDTFAICNKIFYPSARERRLEDQPGYTIVHGEIRDGEIVIDEVLLSIFRAPNSYTGEDGAEISCHGSGYIQQKILELLILNGARPASPGEFTMRAFLNGKMDLSQAEAVADLISSDSEMAHKLAMNQMRGYFSAEIGNLRNELVHLASLIELELDFGEEDVEFADRKQLVTLIDKVLEVSGGLSASFSMGNAIKKGVPVTITGNPNTGKSTLLNKLISEERALVSEIPGTTRDSIEDTTVIEGILFRFIDTAGLRATDDIIERMGISRTYEKIGKSAIIIYMAEVGDDTSLIYNNVNELAALCKLQADRFIVAINKTDTVNEITINKVRTGMQQFDGYHSVLISAKTGAGLEDLRVLLALSAGKEKLKDDGVIISNIRHYEALSKVNESLERVKKGLNDGVPEDFVAMDIRQAIHYLGEITGEISTDEILGNIFRNFCIGK